MNHVIITISGVNCNNFDTLHDLVGISGYSGSLKSVDMETYILDIGDDKHRESCGIKDSEVVAMLGSITLFTSCTVKSELVQSEPELRALPAYGLLKGDIIKIDGKVYIMHYDAFHLDSRLVVIQYRQPDNYIIEQKRLPRNTMVEIVK